MKINTLFRCLLPGTLLAGSITDAFAQSWQSKWVKAGTNGQLKYVPDEQKNILPDFSQVGYYHGQQVIPQILVVKIVTPSANAQQTIQAAIDELSATKPNSKGFRGAILLQKGTYKIPGTLRIGASGIVLRGEGQETRIVATGKGKRSLISVAGKGSITEVADTRQKMTDSYVPVGAKSFVVASVNGYKKGDRIIVYRPGTEAWIHDLQMDQIVPSKPPADSTRQWGPNEYNFRFEREITKVEKNRIYIDNPIVMAIEEKYGGGAIFKYTFEGRIGEIGIENLYLESEYAADDDEDHGWDAVSFNRVENGWMKNVTSRYFGYSCVNLGGGAKNITVDSCCCLDAKSKVAGGRRYSFNNDGQQNLFMNCYASEGRHDYVTGAMVCGPNVFYNCRAQNTHADIGPHHRWAMGTLYDNIVTDGVIDAEDRGNWGTGHGWAGVNQVFWNCTAAKAAIQDPWVSGKNYVIGMKAEKDRGRLTGRTASDWEGQNQPGLQPASLYLAQVKAAKQIFTKHK